MATILLVEDETTLLENCRYALEMRGHNVLGAKSADSALAVCQQYAGPIDVLVSDMMLSLLNGVEVAAFVKAKHSHLAVVLTSGSPKEHSATFVAAHQFLQKPFELSQLIDAVDRCSGLTDSAASQGQDAARLVLRRQRNKTMLISSSLFRY